MASQKKYDTLIIGAGMSGLAAGIRLAHFGKKVAILERQNRVGGLNTYYTKKGREIDAGLHAVTNFAPRGSSTSALSRVFRQLRIRPEEFDLSPQRKSCIAFPGVSLEFTNEFGYLTEQVNENFPSQKDRFRKLEIKIRESNPLDNSIPRQSAREVVSSIITEPLLSEMILCPLMYYGNSMEKDMDYRQFVIMFQSIFLEGLARPRRGIRQILDLLVKRFQEKGGELKLEAGVKEIITADGKAEGVILGDDTKLESGHILSSIGHLETIAICPECAPKDEMPHAGKLTIMESVNILDTSPSEMGLEYSIIFFSKKEKFIFKRPDEPVDVDDGVICAPDNFDYAEPLNSKMIRITNKADNRYWENINPEEYITKKLEWHNRSLEGAADYLPEIRDRIIFIDVFTPRTIKRFTGHINGAVYGAPVKVWSGRTSLPNLFLCGTDQGFLGIIGAMLSGISITNRYLLK